MTTAVHRLKVGAAICVVIGMVGVLTVLAGAGSALLEPDFPIPVALAFALVGTVCTAPFLIAGLGLFRGREWARRLISVVLVVAIVYFSVALALPLIILPFKHRLWSERHFPAFLALYLCLKGLCLFVAWRASRFFASPVVRQITGAA